MKTKETRIALMLILAMIFLLTACKEKPYDEKKIMQDIPADILAIRVDGVGYSMTVDSLEIVKRQTEDRVDEIYCTIVMSNQYYKVEGDYYCCYNYYDKGGWILESSNISNVNISILSEELPSIVEEELLKEHISYKSKFYDIQDVSVEKTNDIGYTIKYNIIRKNTYCYESGTYIIEYFLVNHGGLAFSWEKAEYPVDLLITWDIVGTYVGEDDYCSCELVIDYYNPETNEVHIASFKYVSGKRFWFMGTTEEASDVTATAKIQEPILSKDDKWLRIQFYKDSRGSYTGNCLDIRPDKAVYASALLHKIE